MTTLKKTLGIISTLITFFIFIQLAIELIKGLNVFSNTPNIGNWIEYESKKIKIYFLNLVAAFIVLNFNIICLIDNFRPMQSISNKIIKTQKEIELLKLQKELEDLKPIKK